MQENQVISVNQIYQVLEHILSRYYNKGDITIINENLIVNGNLKSIWERAVTKATVTVKVKDNYLYCLAEGTASLGILPWIWFALGFFFKIFFIWFLVDLLDFIVCRDRPKCYFEEVFESLAFRIEQGYIFEEKIEN